LNEPDTSSFERLVANDERLRAFNDTVPAGILVLRVEDGKMLFANRFFKEVLGVEGATVMGDSWSDYFVDPADRERLMVRFAEAGEVRNLEVCLKRADSRRVWALVSMASIPIEGEDLLPFAFVDITALKEAEAEIRQLANHDPLTGLPSLRLLKERVGQALARAERERTQFAVLFVDLDGFKQVNDSLGHDAGDAVLKRVAAQMLARVRATDTVARFGGDEFVVVLEKISEEMARRIGERIVEQVTQPQTLAQGTARVGASIGIAFYSRHGKSLDALLKAADGAMYRVKSTSKGAIAVAD
jgi:diguanylate cyclase (GGDEF)-like protein/PAS domain S-box-containing protein